MNPKDKHADWLLKPTANELADAMEIRASIRRKATSRKSVTEGANDRLADQLDQAATMLRQQQAKLETTEQKVLDAFERGKMFGYAQGLKKAQEK